jgi:rhodanese-related sulfurtransferase
MEIGLFQLENLLSIRNQFIFLDIRANFEEWPRPLKSLLQTAVHVDQSRNYLSTHKIPPETPIILIDENGERSKVEARELELAGYKQVYTVAEGVFGLLSEL